MESKSTPEKVCFFLSKQKAAGGIMAKNYGHYKELGVTIPDDLQPEDWTFYLLCAPSTVEWRRALHSAVRLLARGRFWKRDDRQDSIKSAQIIGGQIERSLMTCNIDFASLADSIKYLADNMTVQQNIQTNCGCGCGGGTGDTILDELPTQDESQPVDIIPPETGTTQTSLAQQELCNLANYMADSWVNNFVDIAEWWGGITVGIGTVYTFLQEKFPQGALLPFIALIISSLAVALEAALLANLANNMSDAAQSQRDAIVCAISTASNPREAKSNFESVIANSRAQYGKATYTVLILVAQMLDWDKIMSGEVIVPSSYDNSTCPCGEADVQIQVYDNNGIFETLPIYVNDEVVLTGLRSDAYGPFGEFRFVDGSGTPINVTATDYQIVDLNGWQQHNIPQHPFTVQTLNAIGTGVALDIGINQPIPLPYTLQRSATPTTMGQIQVASDVGTSGFTITLKRLA